MMPALLQRPQRMKTKLHRFSALRLAHGSPPSFFFPCKKAHSNCAPPPPYSSPLA